MKRTNATQRKWGAYTLTYFALFALKCLILNRIPISGAIPELAPIAAAAVGCFEGSFGGSLYGMAVGFLCSAVYYRSGTMMIPICTLVGLLSGFTRGRQVGQNVLGVFLCGTFSIVLTEAVRIGYYHYLGGNSFDTLWSIALPEGLYSFAFILPIYIIYALVFNRFRTDMEL